MTPAHRTHVPTRLEGALGAWAGLCERNARSVLVVLALLSIAAGVISSLFMRIDSDLTKLIRPSDELRWYQDDQAYNAAFPHLLQTAVVVVSGPAYAPVVAHAERLRDAFAADPVFSHVFAPSIDPFLAARRLYFLEPEQLELWGQGVEQDYGVLLRLADSAGLANGALTFADQVSAQPRMPLPRPLATLAASFEGGPPLRIDLHGYPHLEPEVDGTHLELIILKGEQRLDASLPNAALLAHIEATLAELAAPPDVRVRLTGEVKLADEEIGAALEGIGLAGTLSVFLLALILGLGVRSPRIIGATFALLGSGILLTLGWATLAVGSFNTLALIFVVMFFGLGVDFVVHYALRLRESVRAPGAEDGAASAAVIAARSVGPALLLCMFTSSIAFLAFVPTAYRGLGELGIISAGGMVIAFALSLTLVPALFALIGEPAPRPEAATRRARPLPPSVVLTVTAVLAIAVAFPASGLRFDYSVLAMRDATTEGMSTLLELQASGIATDYSISVLAEDAADAERIAARLRTLPEVGEVTTPAQLVPPAQVEKRALLQPLAELLATLDPVQSANLQDLMPEAIEFLASVRTEVPEENLAAYDAFAAALPSLEEAERARLDGELERSLTEEIAELEALLTAEPFTLDDAPSAMRALLVTADGRQLVRVQPSTPITDRASAGAFVAAVGAEAPNIAGRTVIEWGVGGVVVESFLQAAALALGVIALLLVLYFRTIAEPLLVLAPIALAALFTAAIAQLTGLSLNMANILVVPLIFGLGVDTGIHVVHRFAHTGDVASLEASSTPRAVTIAGLTTIGTFLSLSFSPHKGAASIGLLLFIAISLLLLATFVVLPALLALRQRLRARGP